MNKLKIALFLLISGSPIFKNAPIVVAIVTSVVFLVFIKDIRLALNEKINLVIISSFIGLLLLQIVFYSRVSITGNLNFMFRILIAAGAAVNLKKSTADWLVVFKLFLMLSMLFHISALSPIIKKLLLNNGIGSFNEDYGAKISNWIVYNSRGLIKGGFRHSGWLWEPGAFAGTIIYMISLFSALKINASKAILFLSGLSVILTFSTMGYIVGGTMLYLSHSANFSRNLRPLVLIVFIVVGVISWQKFDFLGNKITFLIEETEHRDLDRDTKTRFSSALIDARYFLESPLIGKTLDENIRFSEWEIKHGTNRNNGTTDFLVRFGLLGLLIHLVRPIINNKRRVRRLWMCVYFVSFSEMLLLQPLFLMSMFLDYDRFFDRRIGEIR